MARPTLSPMRGDRLQAGMAFDRLIDPAALAPLLATGRVAIFDCSFDLTDPAAGRRLFEEGHVPGAHYLHLDQDLAGPVTATTGRHPLPDPELFAATLRGHGVDSDMQVVAYDRSGGAFAARLWWMMQWLGHTAAAVLDGGPDAWRAAGLPVETGGTAPVKPGTFTPAPDMTRVVDAADVRAKLGSRGRTIIDARTPARFAGEPHPLDAVAGHIPGARNRFYGDNLEGGRFKSPAALHADFAPLLGSGDDEEIVLHCGSGVTACHNALALAIAGVDGAKLYPGSWSEWVSDPARPIQRGGS
jgi:thiosulfate/3-mercaptopyruvate sulfurtransferase